MVANSTYLYGAAAACCVAVKTCIKAKILSWFAAHSDPFAAALDFATERRAGTIVS